MLIICGTCFKTLTWYQWHHENAGESCLCPFDIRYGLHAQSLCVDQFSDSNHHHSSYSPVVCSYYQSFNHDANSYPCYDVSDECYARLNVVMEIMNEWCECFISEMRECGLLHGTNPSSSSSKLVLNLYDDYESSLPLGSGLSSLNFYISHQLHPCPAHLETRLRMSWAYFLLPSI